MNNRPNGVLIVAIILFFAAFLAVIVATTLIFPGTPLDVIWNVRNPFPPGFSDTTIGMIFGYFLLILGLILLCAVYGLIKGMKWAWWIVIIVFAVNGIGDAASVASGGGIGGISGVIIAAALLFYLTRPGVKRFFQHEVTD
jgi:hypothetical protein